MKKKLYVLTAIICSLWSFGQNFTVGGINYTVTSATSPFTVRVGANTSFVGAATIPTTVTNGATTYTVTSIASQAFQGCTGLTTVNLPSSITSLGGLAFYQCSNLTAINLPNSITSIGDQAFQSCTSLTSVTIPNAMTTIQGATFLFCTGLTTVSLPNSVTSIGNSAFRGCTSLSSINMPTALTAIGAQAFQQTALTSVIIPNSVTTIGSSSFQLCNNLNTFVFGNAITSVGNSIFFACPNLTSVTLSNSITTIGDYSFYACSNLASITFPNSVTSIGSNAFGQCLDITSIIIPGSVTTIGASAFTQCTSLTSVTLPSSITSIGNSAFSSCFALNSFTVNWTTPVVITASVFQSVSQSNVTLNVPVGTRATYLAAPVWQNFTIPCLPTATPTAIATQVYAGSGTLANVLVNGTSIKWYTTATNGSLLPDTTSLVDGSTYYASQTVSSCESPTRVAVTVRKISESNQSLCGPVTIGDLVTTPSNGTTVNCYLSATATTALENSTNLTSGTYYLEQSTPQTLTSFGNEFDVPCSIVTQSDGKILIADRNNNAIKRMNADGTNVEILGSGFNKPRGVAVHADGKIVIADTDNNVIKRMDADGTNIVTLATGFSTPHHVTIQADGKILIADTFNHAIKRMNADGTGITTLGSGFLVPCGVTVQADGKILVADTFNNSVKRMDADGANITILGSGFNFPTNIAVQADGKILVTNPSSNILKSINADGSDSNSIVFFPNPYGVAVESNGNILVTSTGYQLVYRITKALQSNRVPINVSVIPTSNNVTNIVACDSYTWSNSGITYTTSGVYNGTTANCVTEVLNLTINNSSTTSETITACDSYTWLENGTTYFTSGVYTNTTTNASGCTNVATLNLTINNSTTDNNVTVTAINSYTWDAPLGSGLTYTTSGVYTHTTTNEAGCTNVATLTLTIPPIVNSFVIGSSCGSVVSSLAVTIISPLVSGVASYMFRVTNVATNASFVVTRAVNSFALSNYPGVLLGTQYQVEVSTNGGATYGPPCIVFTPAPTSTIGAQCGTTVATMNTFVYATYVSVVTGYRFRVTNLTTSGVQVYDALSGQNRFNFNQLSPAIRAFGTTYSVEVALRNTDGTYLPYGTACNVSTPAFPTSEIILSQCDSAAASNTQTFSAVVVSGATDYRFQLVNSGLGYSFSIDRPLNSFSLSLFPGLQAGTTYTVKVAVRIGGVWGPLTGKPCNITTPGIAPGGERVVVATNDFAVITYPNPFTESFMFDVKTSNESTVQVRVYDMLGKQVENRTFEASEMNNIQIGSTYPSGVYNVIVSQGENTQTLRVIKR